MFSTGGNAARKVVADAFTFNWKAIEIRFAVRCTVGIALPLLVASLAGAPLSGSLAAFGALVTGLASRQGVYRTRIGVMLTAGASLALSGLAGAITSVNPVLNIVTLAVWALVLGIVGSLGRAATIVSLNGCVAFVLFSNPPYDESNPGIQALMLFAGCALQIFLLVLVWPLNRFRAERTALCAAFSALSQYARGLRADDLGLPDTTSVAAVSAALADPQPFGGRGEIAAYQALADEAERLRATLAALATEQHLLGELGLPAVAEAIRETGHAAAQLLDDIANAVTAGRPPSHQLEDVRALENALAALERVAPPGSPYVDDARGLAGQLRAALRSAAAAANGGLTVEADVPRRMRMSLRPVRTMFERLVANCSWHSIYLRHAIRLTVTLTVATVIQHLLPLAHGQWICLTVILVLRPDFSSTFTRGVGRVAGTIAGAVIASLIAAFHPSDPAYIALAIVFAGCAFALFNVSYTLFSMSITCYVVYLLAFGGAAEHTAAFDRVLAALIGGALALIAYVAWPAWTHSHVGDDLADLVDAQRKYVVAVLLAFAEPNFDDTAVRGAQVTAWRARSNAEAAVDLMAGEPVRPTGLTLRTALGILAATRRFGIAGLTLRARHARIPGAPHALIEHFVTDLDITLRSIVESLRSGDPPAIFAPLRNDQITLQHNLAGRSDPAVEILGSETDLIVDSVNTMTNLLARAR